LPIAIVFVIFIAYGNLRGVKESGKVFAALAFTVPGKGAPIGAYTSHGADSYVSAPLLHPPTIVTSAPPATDRLASGYFLTANFYHVVRPPIVGQSGPLVLDNNLQPVWFKPVSEDVVASNLSAQTYHGRPVLAWWQGVVTNAGTTATQMALFLIAVVSVDVVNGAAGRSTPGFASTLVTDQGTSEIGNIRQIDRGYERIDERLRALGASIERV